MQLLSYFRASYQCDEADFDKCCREIGAKPCIAFLPRGEAAMAQGGVLPWGQRFPFNTKPLVTLDEEGTTTLGTPTIDLFVSTSESLQLYEFLRRVYGDDRNAPLRGPKGGVICYQDAATTIRLVEQIPLTLTECGTGPGQKLEQMVAWSSPAEHERHVFQLLRLDLEYSASDDENEEHLVLLAFLCQQDTDSLLMPLIGNQCRYLVEPMSADNAPNAAMAQLCSLWRFQWVLARGEWPAILGYRVIQKRLQTGGGYWIWQRPSERLFNGGSGRMIGFLNNPILISPLRSQSLSPFVLRRT